MASPSSSLLLLILCSSSLHLTLINCIDLPKQQANHVPLFVFGDSLFDPGNNQYLNGSMEGQSPQWPYGETFFKHPTGRLSDGRIVPDFVAEFAMLPILPPYLQPGIRHLIDGSNFASAGAGVLVETHPGTINLRMQLSYLKEVKKKLTLKMGPQETRKILERAVYLFSIGGNDYFSYYMTNPNATQLERREYVKIVTSNLTQVLQEIYDMGGRKVGFQNAGPLGCLPGMKSMNHVTDGRCIDGLSGLARLHNRILAKILKNLEATLPGFQYSIFDYYNSLYERIINPSKYGFKNGQAACCGSGAYRAFQCGQRGYELCSNPSEYVWFDGGHTTEKANLQLAHLIWSGTPKVTGPYNFKQLFGH